MRKFLLLILLILAGCASYAKTSVNTHYPNLQPQVLNGTIEEIYEIAFNAAKKAFPEEPDIWKEDDWKIFIERKWFWRGDTLIKVKIKDIDGGKCLVEVESRGIRKRMNQAIFDSISEGEIKYYISILKEEYEEYISPKSENSGNRSLSERLAEINHAYDKGLLSKEQYELKKKTIIDEY